MPLDFLQTCFTPIEHCMCTGLQNRCKNRMKEKVCTKMHKSFFSAQAALRMIPVDLVWDPPSNLLLLPQSQFSFESCKKTGSSPDPLPHLLVNGKQSSSPGLQRKSFFLAKINSSTPHPIPFLLVSKSYILQNFQL